MVTELIPVDRCLPDRELAPPCPRCGDRDRPQMILVEMPALRPAGDEMNRIRMAGCVVDGDTPTEPWWCPACKQGYPWTYPFARTLLIRAPWASLVVEGRKTWELRRSTTRVRGLIGLSPSGSGVVAGRAELADVHGPFTVDELRVHRERHLVDDESLYDYAAGRPLYAWELRAAHPFRHPVPYTHPRGATTWVKLPLSRPVVCPLCRREYPAADPYHRGCVDREWQYVGDNGS